MSARNPLHNDPHESTHGEGNYGVRFTRFVQSGAPGGYSTVETVHLFPTREERDAYARHLRQKERPRHRTGPLIETIDADVAALSWFEGPYERAVLVDEAEHRYGLVRVYDTDPLVYEFKYARDEEELRWMLATQWSIGDTEGLAGTPAPGEPHAPYDVFFFTADQRPHLRLVIEQDDEPSDETEDSK